MLGFKKSNSFYFLLIITISSLLSSSTTQHEQQPPPSPYLCGKIRIQHPFLSSNMSSPLARMIKCNSHKLYFRTSLGLFAVSSVDYTTKLLTLAHPSSSSSSDNYVSPSLLSAGLPSPQPPNSLLLLNCSRRFRHPTKPSTGDCNPSDLLGQELNLVKDWLLVKNADELDDAGFHPKDLGCSSYRRVYSRRSLSDERVEIGTRVSFDVVPDHLPDICKECEKPNGNCGVGLKCICHARECKDRVISRGRSLSTGVGNILFSWVITILTAGSFLIN